MTLPNRFAARLLPCLLLGGFSPLAPLAAAPRPVDQAAKRPAAVAQAATWNTRGKAAFSAKDYGRAVECFRRAAALAPHDVAYVTNLAVALQDGGRYPQALAVLDAASPKFTAPADRREIQEARADLHYTWGLALERKSQFVQAAAHDKVAAMIDRSIRPHDSAIEFAGAAQNLVALGLNEPAIPLFEQAVAMIRQTDDRPLEEIILNGLGVAQLAVGDNRAGIETFTQAIKVAQGRKDRGNEGMLLGSLGLAYNNVGQYDQALACFAQALPILHAVESQLGEATVLNNRGETYYHLSRYTQALADYRQALPVAQRLHAHDMEGKLQNNIGQVFSDLGQYDQALAALLQALPPLRAAKDRNAESLTLNNIGLALVAQGQYSKAAGFYRQAFHIETGTRNFDAAATTLNNLGAACDSLDASTEAMELYGQGLKLARKAGDRSLEARIRSNLGSSYLHREKYDLAVAEFQPALALEREVGDRAAEGATLTNLMAAWGASANPRLAVFYGKQSVNTYQDVRRGNAMLDKQSRKSYLASHAATYRTLADLLIGQGRLPEAEQILAMLKDEEVSDFVTRDATLAPETLLVSFDTDEQAVAVRYQKLADPVTQIGHQIETLRAKKGRTDAEDAQLVGLQDQLTPAKQKFQAFLAEQLPAELAQAKPDTDRPDIRAAQGLLQKQLAQMGTGTVALFTLIEPDRYRVIVVTSQTTQAEEYPIKAEDLRKKVLAWRQALSDPRLDPRPLGQELSRILIGPIEKDLIGAQATTLMWSLDDVLRYVPLAALYDGHQYLAEKYRTAVFTGASVPALTLTTADWQGGGDDVMLALGVTEAHSVPAPDGGPALAFPALPGVAQEIRQVARYAGSPDGALAGRPLQDAAFTADAFRRALAHGYPVVHVASHFALGTNYKSSFLLLGDGTALTLDALCGQGGQVFQGVDLLTLSACQTAEAGGDGHEFESLAALAQQQGASSVLASLWPVSDASTPLLMHAFYQGRADTTGTSKAEALRQAQIALLHGTAPTAQTAAPGRGTALSDTPRGGGDQAPAFTPDPKAPYAHPFYWAPFVLIGNWK